MEAIVLAGGLGTRLKGKIEGLPKPMAPVAGRPFLEILLGQLARAGCSRVILSVGYLHEVIESHFGAAWCGMTVDYAIESEPLGTGGAIRAALKQGREENILILNGDTFLEADYAEMVRFHDAQPVQMTMAVTHQADVARYGGVRVEADRIVGFEEKGRSGPGWINAGAYVVRRDLEWPAGLAEKFSFETDFLAREITRTRPAAYKVDGLFIDIGIPEDLARAQTVLAGFDP
ncbi:MAG TPA: nucleotidyltransferase family protein [Terracidiphilus sp.]|nr:nucleotidyltransferase family protein [Terracidiphilus sp.]